MYKHILVPLDGSTLAENALPAASYLAKKLNSHVTLLHIIEENPPQDIHGQKHITDAKEARAYLKKLSVSHFDPDIEIDIHIHREKIENVANGIVSHTRHESRPDLIILCAHGNGGLRDIFLGNIAQQVLSNGLIPVLLIDVSNWPNESSFELRTLLLPLDGNAEHEKAFSTGMELARSCGSNIILLMVIPTLTSLKGERAATGIFLPGAMNVALDQMKEDAESYINHHLSILSAGGISAASAVVRGDPATLIANAAYDTNTDLIILGTHAKVGGDAFWASSVASKVSKMTHKPILFLPVKCS